MGIMFLLAERIVRMDDPADSFKKLAYYMLTVLLGIGIHAVILLPCICFFLARANPFKLAAHMSQALLTAWGTASRYRILVLKNMVFEFWRSSNRFNSKNHST